MLEFEVNDKFYSLGGIFLLIFGIIIEAQYFYFNGLYGGLVTGQILLLLSLNFFTMVHVCKLQKELEKC